jgi:hypothetical protein
MMTTIYDGGPANPIGNVTGISIRDYFATAIMTGVYSSGSQATITAEDAYKVADTMLTARTADLYPVAVPVVEEPVVETLVEETPTESTE